MNAKFCVSALVAIVLALATQAMAAPLTPFLAVDINGYNAGGGQSVGPTQAGYQGWEAAEGLFLDPSIDWGSSGAGGLTRVFATSEGNITVKMIGVAPNSFLGARNRGANSGAYSDLTSDFVFSQRNVDGFGQTYIKLEISGLVAGTDYEFTGFAREAFNGGVDSFQSWSDQQRIGLDGPGAYMDANFGAGAVYQPVAGGANNPIPTAARTATSGADSQEPFAYAATFLTTTNGSGIASIYTWADPNSFSGTQTATLLNGFQLAIIPEPSSLLLLFAGSYGSLLLGRFRRRRFQA